MYRRCFLPLLPEHDRAADLLSRAADALLAGNFEQAEGLLLKADLQALEDYRYAVAGPINPAIIRQVKLPALPPLPRKGRPRMPSKGTEEQVLIQTRLSEVRPGGQGASEVAAWNGRPESHTSHPGSALWATDVVASGGNLIRRVRPVQGLHEEETECRASLLDGAGGELAVFEQVGLIGADVLRSKLVGALPEVRREVLDGVDVASYGILSVITTLEFVQHHSS